MYFGKPIPEWITEHRNDTITLGEIVDYCEKSAQISNSLDETQRLALYYIVGKAVEDAKKGKTSKSDEDKKLKHNAFDFGQFS